MPKVKKATKAKKTSSKSKKTASKETTVPEVVAAPVPEVAAVPATDTPSVPTLTESFGELLGQLQALRSQLTSVTGQVRALQKRADRELKNAHKASKKRQKRT